MIGALDGPQCYMSILRNVHVPCYFYRGIAISMLIFKKSGVEYNKYHVLYRLFVILLSLGSMLHVSFNSRPCRRVELKGKGPTETPGICSKLLRKLYISHEYITVGLLQV